MRTKRSLGLETPVPPLKKLKLAARDEWLQTRTDCFIQELFLFGALAVTAEDVPAAALILKKTEGALLKHLLHCVDPIDNSRRMVFVLDETTGKYHHGATPTDEGIHLVSLGTIPVLRLHGLPRDIVQTILFDFCAFDTPGHQLEVHRRRQLVLYIVQSERRWRQFWAKADTLILQTGRRRQNQFPL